MLRVQVIIFNGFDELDAIAPFEVLQTATAVGADLRVELVTLDGTAKIRAAHGTCIQPDTKLETDQKLDILIVPGGGWVRRAQAGAWAEAQRGDIPTAISHLHQNGTTIASVCTGAMLIAAAGLLTNRPAITHHEAVEELSAAGAKIVRSRVVDDGDILTSGGITSGLDLALWLLERYFNPQTAHMVESELEYERRGTVWRQPESNEPMI